jgi:hypothetical protein
MGHEAGRRSKRRTAALNLRNLIGKGVTRRAGA